MLSVAKGSSSPLTLFQVNQKKKQRGGKQNERKTN
ncbi:hypothetical protein FUSO6_03865 [Fusobacterium necrophorum DAB]|nr:hypothetical protein FUSO6_03865 [Fusobacterium necrophorum DAB]